MKKYIVLSVLCALIISSNLSMAQTTIDKIEQSLFGYTFPKESDSARLNRIEEQVYGKVSGGTEQNRIAKLNKDLSADLLGQEIEPREDTFMSDEDSILYEKEPPEALSMDYPVINELEQSVFKKDFRGQNIKTRLSNLEKQIFKKSYESDDLSTRVDRLKAQIRPGSFMSNGMKQQENDFYTEPADKLSENYHLNQYGSPDIDYSSFSSQNYDYMDDDYAPVFKNSSKPLNLSSIEKKLYHSKFDKETTSQRLNRIESSVFGTTFSNDSESERMARISSAIQAQKSSKQYDSNKWSQNVATAVQIGTLILMVLACIL